MTKLINWNCFYKAGLLTLCMLVFPSSILACENWRDVGITEICTYENDVLIAIAPTYPEKSIFISEDGGFHWRQESHPSIHQSRIECDPNRGFIVDMRHNQYRWKSGHFIEVSRNQGVSWNKDYDFMELEKRQDIYFYFYKKYQGHICGRMIELELGPFDAAVDAKTGNVAFAMGWNGVLMRTNDGKYFWVKLDIYGINMDKLENAFLLLNLWFGLLLLPLLASSLIVIPNASNLLNFISLVNWGLLIFSPFYLTQHELDWFFKIASGNIPAFLPLILVVTTLSILVFTLVTLKLFEFCKKIYILSAIIVVIYIIPYVLWKYLPIFSYTNAQVISTSILIAALLIIFAKFYRKSLK